MGEIDCSKGLKKEGEKGSRTTIRKRGRVRDDEKE